jgi:phage shock protein PspC (stress-responsive transcriptional regulator)
MQRVITVSLNRNPFQFEEDAHARLQAYLAEASLTLVGNPDRDEILADLEQAIADQCKRRMSPHQGVITLAELQPALEEIGSVQVPGASTASGHAAPTGTPALQQISEGALISGVCLGLAQYLKVDVTLLRIIAVILLLVSGGTVILVYLVLMLLLPFAPIDPKGKPIGKIPLKARELVLFVRSKFGIEP